MKLKPILLGLFAALIVGLAIYFAINPPEETYVAVERPMPASCVAIKEVDGVRQYMLIDSLDLAGGVMTLPENGCLTIFSGSLSNGTLRGQHSTVVAPRRQVFFNMTFEGDFAEGIEPVWIGE